MGRKAYKINNINEISEYIEISVCTFSYTISDRYVKRFLVSTNMEETLLELVETLIESDYDKLETTIAEWEDLILDVKVSTDWNIQSNNDESFVRVKVELLLKDETDLINYDYTDTYRATIVVKG